MSWQYGPVADNFGGEGAEYIYIYIYLEKKFIWVGGLGPCEPL